MFDAIWGALAYSKLEVEDSKQEAIYFVTSIRVVFFVNGIYSPVQLHIKRSLKSGFVLIEKGWKSAKCVSLCRTSVSISWSSWSLSEILFQQVYICFFFKIHFHLRAGNFCQSQNRFLRLDNHFEFVTRIVCLVFRFQHCSPLPVARLSWSVTTLEQTYFVSVLSFPSLCWFGEKEIKTVFDSKASPRNIVDVNIANHFVGLSQSVPYREGIY